MNAGCGSGELSFILAQNGYEVTGFDLDRDYIDLANKNVKKMKVKNCKFIVSGIENYKNEKKYDVVVSTDVLEHILNDRYAFRKLSSFAKKDGLVVISVPAGQYLFGFHDEQLGHFRRYSISSFKKIIPENLKIIKVKYFGLFLIPIAFFVSRLLKIGYPVEQSGDTDKYLIINKILKSILKIEKQLWFPAGTSLLFIGKHTRCT